MGDSEKRQDDESVVESPKPVDGDAEESDEASDAETVDETIDELERDFERADQAAGEDETGKLRDALLRTRAEMDNLHKRSEREIEKTRRYAVEGLLRDLVPVIDSLDQGLESVADADGTASEGLSLTRRLLLDTLVRYGLTVVDPLGERFDPQWHEAMSMQPSQEDAPDTVISVLQKGYRLHDRVVRPARVIVAREPDE
jgi:molecular chaperone GrpE